MAMSVMAVRAGVRVCVLAIAFKMMSGETTVVGRTCQGLGYLLLVVLCILDKRGVDLVDGVAANIPDLDPCHSVVLVA